MQQIDSMVKKQYNNHKMYSWDPCKATIEKLGLPLFLANPIVDKAFRSHLYKSE